MPCCHPLPHHRRLSIAVGLSLDRLSPSRPGSQINRAVVEKDLDNQLRNGDLPHGGINGPTARGIEGHAATYRNRELWTTKSGATAWAARRRE